MSKKQIFRGWLTLGTNGEKDDILCLQEDLFRHTGYDFIAEKMQSVFGYGKKMVTIRYFTADKELSEDEFSYELAKVATGYAEADYGMAYSEITGYLWTTEDFEVGGHDMIEELKTHVGKFLHMEIVFGRPKDVE